MASKWLLEINTCSNLLPASAPVCWGPSAPARKLSPHLPFTSLIQAPRAGSTVSPSPSPSGKQGVGKWGREEGLAFHIEVSKEGCSLFPVFPALGTLRDVSTGVISKVRRLQGKNKHWSTLVHTYQKGLWTQM